MIKRLLLSVVAVICVVSSGTALFANAPEKLMVYDGQNVKAQIYGFIKLDLVSNSRDVFNESSPFWVQNNALATGDTTRGAFLIDARSTRIGLKITGPEVIGASTSFLIEGDFWGQMPNSGSASRQSMFRMRHALAKFNWDFGAYLMIGQYWSMMMPLKTLPHTVAFIPLASSGLLFMREQQIAIGQTVGPDMFNVTIEGAIARPQGGGDPGGTGYYAGSRDTQIDTAGNGEASKMPAYRARVSATFAPMDMINVHFGGAYAYHEERFELLYTDATPAVVSAGLSENHKSYCMLAFAKIQVWMFSLTGHYYTGQNLDTFFAGMLQGVYSASTATTVADARSHVVPAHGGFGELSIDLRKLELPAMVNLGYGVDALRMRSWMDGTSLRLWNSTMYGNIWVFLHPNYRVGFEVALMETNHGNTEDNSTNQRYQLSFQFVF